MAEWVDIRSETQYLNWETETEIDAVFTVQKLSGETKC